MPAGTVVLFAIEKGHRIDTDSWTQDVTYTNCWWIGHSRILAGIEREGKPSRVAEDLTEYVERSTISDCNANPGSWWWDAANKRLYVHTSGSNNPGGGTYIILSYIWVRVATEPYDFGGKPHLPLVKAESISDLTYSTAGYHEGGTQQTFGVLRLINANGFFDEEFSDYIWERKRIVGRSGVKGAQEGSFFIFLNQWTSTLEWRDEEVAISVDDLRNG